MERYSDAHFGITQLLPLPTMLPFLMGILFLCLSFWHLFYSPQFIKDSSVTSSTSSLSSLGLWGKEAGRGMEWRCGDKHQKTMHFDQLIALTKTSIWDFSYSFVLSFSVNNLSSWQKVWKQSPALLYIEMISVGRRLTTSACYLCSEYYFLYFELSFMTLNLEACSS